MIGSAYMSVVTAIVTGIERFACILQLGLFGIDLFVDPHVHAAVFMGSLFSPIQVVLCSSRLQTGYLAHRQVNCLGKPTNAFITSLKASVDISFKYNRDRTACII